MIIECAWCRLVLGEKEGEGITHTICQPCSVKFLEEAEAYYQTQEKESCAIVAPSVQS